ncbi:hypothetical protein Ct61P_14606 [Colletotrichum tofieldiae]|nr:hypothetical protein Ct61P_14606 [Colletotrichum tofieldiae]
MAPFAPSTASVGWLSDDITAINTTASNITRISKTIPTGQRLTALISDIQQQLWRLQVGPWHTDSAHSLHDCPIGTILELSQQFSAVVAPIHRSTVFVGGELDKGGSDRTTSLNAADTPNMLLIMCGYMWIVNIYDVVLDHFQVPTPHASRLPFS